MFNEMKSVLLLLLLLLSVVADVGSAFVHVQGQKQIVVVVMCCMATQALALPML